MNLLKQSDFFVEYIYLSTYDATANVVQHESTSENA